MTEKYVPAELRRQVTQRARGCCEYCRCQAQYSPQSLSIEHVIPKCAGGLAELDNLALSCQGCNAHKAAKTATADPATGLPVPLFHPRRQSWSEHFSWSEDFTEIFGLTPTGRATVEALKLNRAGLVNLRCVLYAEGSHPPSEA